MCGIAGFVGLFDPEMLHTMEQAMAHRGPDGAGVWHDPETGVGLAHRRLSIIDLSENAAQPMLACGDRYTLVFNGEIYNFKELHNELDLKGYVYNKNSDTAVLAPLYDLYGPAMLARLNGIFAFAIYDRKTQELFIARDHAGIKPLYYADTSKGLVFASEIKSLIVYPEVKRDLDLIATHDYLTYLWTPSDRTALRDVRKLLPGHYMIVKNGEYRIHQWFEPKLPEIENGKPQYNYVKSSEDLLGLFDTVVADQALSDVKIGAFLSGGVDSSAIVSSLVLTGHRPANTYCVSFQGANMEDEGFSNDRTYAKQVAEKYNLPLTDVRVAENCLDDVPNMISYLEEPTADPAPLYVNAIAAAAKADGIKVLLGGTGGDDVFSGYRRHQAAMLYTKLGTLGAKSLSQFFPLMAKFTNNESLRRRLQKLHYLFSGDAENFLLRSFEFSPRQNIAGLFSHQNMVSYECKYENRLKTALRRSKGQHLLNRMLFMEFHGFLPDHNLHYTDKAGMAEGVEIRVPFLDPRLLHFARDLPVEQKIKGKETKYILKKALEGRLPHDVLYRPKAGFGAPLRKWFTQPGKTRDWVHDILFSQRVKERGLFEKEKIARLFHENETGQADHTYLVFALICLELWQEQFIDQSQNQAVAA